MAEATALFGMPGSTVLTAARVAGEWEVLIETAQECQARRQVAGYAENRVFRHECGSAEGYGGR